MITNREVKNLVTEWGLRDDVIEKDYVIGWVLWGIGSDPELLIFHNETDRQYPPFAKGDIGGFVQLTCAGLNKSPLPPFAKGGEPHSLLSERSVNRYWAFKGGTSLKKCFVETWRFSEDLDFTVLPEGPTTPEVIGPLIRRVLARVQEESGIDFSLRPPVYKYKDKHLYTEGKIYYRGPQNAPFAASIKLDICGSEKVASPTVLRGISHPYSDALPEPAIRCYAFEEVFAEKLRAMGERGRPRDLYDIVLLFRRRDLQAAPELIRSIFEKKCRTKGIPIPTLDSIQNASTKAELISEWKHMLGHQLQALPPFEHFWAELPGMFHWLNGVSKPSPITPMPHDEDEDLDWTPPPTIWRWGLGIPLESMRFAAVNRLCVELGYDRSVRLIEPYSLRRTKDGNLLLHAIKVGTGESRSYRVDRIESVKVSDRIFKPRYEIEFFSTGNISVKPAQRKGKTRVGIYF